MQTYYDKVGHDKYMAEERAFWTESASKERSNRDNWYRLNNSGYWQLCFHEEEAKHWQSQGIPIRLINSKRLFIYDHPLAIGLFDGAAPTYKE